MHVYLEDVECILHDAGLLERFKQIADIRNKLEYYHRQREAEEQRHAKQTAELQAQLEAIQGACKHQHKSFYPDAAGGSDSFHRCNICRKEL